ncbi:putative methyltransferase-domain-containing protein [Hysterangium stoloniferum]|nr:putative methyltransferase-domain-containing protein [Hysterangium stoloniferum]
MAKIATSIEIFSSSLHTLYSHTPITFTGNTFIHKPSGLTFVAPNTSPSNWELHASSIWIASLFLANHIRDVASLLFSPQQSTSSVLELGAASGMPGILLAKLSYPNITVTLSDYPDDAILACLKENIKRNNIPDASTRVIGHTWGLDTTQLGLFDLVMAADTLWNPDQHFPFCQTLSRVLRRTSKARIFLVAGLHTGRWTIHRFLEILPQFHFEIDLMVERKVDSTFDSDAVDGRPMARDWMLEREGEEESDRRKWIVWMVLSNVCSPQRQSYPAAQTGQPAFVESNFIIAN